MCGCEGIHVDTDAGEIVIDGTPYGVPLGTWLMTEADGSLSCDECHEGA